MPKGYSSLQKTATKTAYRCAALTHNGRERCKTFSTNRFMISGPEQSKMQICLCSDHLGSYRRLSVPTPYIRRKFPSGKWDNYGSCIPPMQNENWKWADGWEGERKSTKKGGKIPPPIFGSNAPPIIPKINVTSTSATPPPAALPPLSSSASSKPPLPSSVSTLPSLMPQPLTLPQSKILRISTSDKLPIKISSLKSSRFSSTPLHSHQNEYSMDLEDEDSILLNSFNTMNPIDSSNITALTQSNGRNTYPISIRTITDTLITTATTPEKSIITTTVTETKKITIRSPSLLRQRHRKRKIIPDDDDDDDDDDEEKSVAKRPRNSYWILEQVGSYGIKLIESIGWLQV